ncbi:MAG: type I secretion C-terminal target domain-containing protein, partial [Moraxellaceae bacterium]
DSANDTLSINIVDDVPDAINNTDPDIVSENSTVTTGNVLGNDVQGADGASVTPAVLAGTFGTLTLNADGSYSYTLNTSDADFVNLVGGATANEVFNYTLTDSDGDSDTATLTLTIRNDDDGVTITNLTPSGQGGDALVDEDDLPDGSDTDKEPLTTSGNFSISAPDGVDDLTIGGTIISYADLANSGTVPVVIVTALGNTLTIDGYSGNSYGGTVSYSYSLDDNEAHSSGNGENSLFDNLAVTVTDADGDADNDILSIQIIDDVPQAFSPLSGYVNNADGSSGSFALDIDGNIDNNTGADQAGLITFSSSQDGTDSGLTSLGDSIYLYVSADGQTLTGSTAATEGAVSTSNSIFTVTLNQDSDFALANDTYSVTMSGVIDNGASVGFADLSGTGEAGNPSFKIVESGVAGQEILFTPVGGATSVNSDEDDVGVDSQWVNFPEGLRIDFGEFSTANGGDDYLVNTNNTINGFSFSINQIAGGTTASILLKAYDADTDENLNNDPLDPITKILVYSSLGVLLAASDTGNAAGISFVDHGDGTWTVSGAQSDFNIVTLTADGYSRIEIYNDDSYATDAKFSLSNLEVLVTDTGTPIEQSFDLTLTDTDGDSVDGSLSVTFEPAALATGTTITGTADADTLYGGAGNDTLNGLAGNDLLDGGSGNDTMDGGADNDTLIGNSGNDTMTGGTGADVFVWQLGEGGTTMSPAEDTITDFADGIGGDQLDLRDLLVGEESAPLTDYLHFDLDGSDTVISVSSTGAFDGSNYASATDQRIVLSNVDLVTGSSGDTDIISNLVATSNLRTDV